MEMIVQEFRFSQEIMNWAKWGASRGVEVLPHSWSVYSHFQDGNGNLTTANARKRLLSVRRLMRERARLAVALETVYMQTWLIVYVEKVLRCPFSENAVRQRNTSLWYLVNLLPLFRCSPCQILCLVLLNVLSFSPANQLWGVLKPGG